MVSFHVFVSAELAYLPRLIIIQACDEKKLLSLSMAGWTNAETRALLGLWGVAESFKEETRSYTKRLPMK